jgi:hypothetical protein
MSNNVAQLLPLTALGDLRNAELTPQFQGSFEYTVGNTEINTNTVAAGGTVTQATAMALIGTSTTTASTALLQSKRTTGSHAGVGGLLRFATIFTAGVAATEQYAGLADTTGSTAAFENGYMIGFDGATFGFHRFSNDSKTTVNLSAWDDPLDGTGASGMTIDLAKLNAWAIGFQGLGAGAVTVYVQDQATGEYVAVNRLDYTNQNTEPTVYNPSFSFTAWANNKATTDDLVLKTASYAYFVEGKSGGAVDPQFSSGKTQKTTVTTETAIFTIRSKSTYASKTSYIEAAMERLTASIEASTANNLGEIRIVRGTTLGGTPSYTDISASDSVMEIDTAGTTLTGGKELAVIELAGKNDRENIDLTPYLMRLSPGETLTVSGSSANSATINAAIAWRELF